MPNPGLTLHRLELFLAVLDAGGVGRAAQARRLSQPAVSEHLRGLEAFFGVPLFERAGRGVRPTSAARVRRPVIPPAVWLVERGRAGTCRTGGLGGGAGARGA